jgi:hypothetical protein
MTDDQIARQKSRVITVRNVTPEQIYREVAEIRARDGLPPVEVPEEYSTPGTPGLLTMAGNLAAAVVAHVADGGRKASEAVQAERLAVCQSNVCGQHDAAKDACLACGCGLNPALSFVGLDLALKRSWASSVCPGSSSRWGPE